MSVSIIFIPFTESVVISFGQLSLTVDENAGQFNMCVVKSTTTQFVVSVDISITDLMTTATQGQFLVCSTQYASTAHHYCHECTQHTDYDPNSIPDTITIMAADDQACFTGTINDDELSLEGDEQFRLTLSNALPSEVFIGRGTTTITIHDNDGQCSTILSGWRYSRTLCY